MKKYFWFFLIANFFLTNATNAALPFVTDDADIAKPDQLMIETYFEKWNIPADSTSDKGAAKMYGQYLAASYGINKRLEFALAGMVSHNQIANSTAFMNPIAQLKVKLFEPEPKSALPMLAVDFSYVNKNGAGEYFDPATNFYAIGVATTKMLDGDVIMHVNLGKKASYNIPVNNVMRTHLGVGFDVATFLKNIRLVFESYNGAPNSPRDSPSWFRSHQVAIKWNKSDSRSFYVVYGEQPTFIDYNDQNKPLYRNTNWVEIGMRASFDNVFFK